MKQYIALGVTVLAGAALLEAALVPGIVIGSYAAGRIPERMLRVALATILVIVATKLSFDIHPFGSADVEITASHAH